MYNKKNILIGTTAINRPELHNDNIKEWHDWINNIDKSKYDLHWFINIDYVSKLPFSIEETKNNLSNIINQIPITFLQSPDNSGNFLKACQRVSTNIENYVNNNKLNHDDVIIIWLEDDWKLNTQNIPLENLIDNYLSGLTSINLSFLRPNYIHALAPSIINYNLWKLLHLEAWKKQVNHTDPEHCVGLYFIKNFTKYELINNLTIISDYKSVDENYFRSKFLNYKNSFYTYQPNSKNNIFKHNFVKPNEITNFFNNKITFVRITPKFTFDLGRNYMHKFNITKTKKQNNNNLDYYN